ncbi:Beta-1,2-xylosyltransferase 1 [Colletotrichum sidae]|uniref:Beta-1,2-xylosyltransferase 1 n=1 Tax=Colletotrichum sidae TaxID=1347389 RepID=A0A4R8TW78_9PEZI|nr:Beta-1,2-xylosyltransferase 1 [Colletotrichum sidae]
MRLRRNSKARRIAILSAFCLAVFLFDCLSGGVVGDFLSLSAAVVDNSPGRWDRHPVVLLHREAEKQFENFLSRQSKSPVEAEVEYQSRYGREPPPGFRRWVEYALANHAPVIDDYDIIVEGVHPFLNYSAAELTRKVDDALKDSIGKHSAICELASGSFGSGCRNWADPLTRLLGDAAPLVPDVKFLINFLDEPSVLPGNGAERSGNTESTSWADMSHHNMASTIAEACRDKESAVTNAPQTTGIIFVTNITAERDLCQHPEYASQHGFVMCPTTFHRLSSHVPMLSRAAPNPFADILFPATHYSLDSSLYSPWSDWTWSAKKNAVYWTGSSNGGKWSSETWRGGHRQRLVALATGRDARQFTLLRSNDMDQPTNDEDASFQPYTADDIDTDLFDVGLTRNAGCASASVCEEQARFFGPLRRPDAESRPLRYRFAMDVDGNSFSGRFYRFLASRSVPLKVSVFREWHDDRLWPWLHYIPVSVDMGELPELVRFLTSTAEGQQIGRRVAEAGSEWYSRALAPKQQGIYLYRLMLEMARLQDESREPG